MENRKTISLVVPVYFEQECIQQFLKETKEMLDTLPVNYEWVFVDDGSTDNTVALIQQAAQKDNRIKLVELSYNHGKQAAVTAGITYAKGDYLLYMDPDLQDPPVEIPRFLEEIEQGYDVVYGVRKEKKDGVLNRLYSKIFWGVLRRFTGLEIPKGIAVMRMFNRAFADRFLAYKEQNRFIEGIFLHIGMNSSQLLISQRERFAGKTKFNFRRKMRLAMDAIFDFSETPLKVAVKIGLWLILLSVLAVLGIVLSKIFIINFQAGWPSVFTAVIFSAGLQLCFIGIAAIYIGRIYKESKNRPLFSVKKITNLQ